MTTRSTELRAPGGPVPASAAARQPSTGPSGPARPIRVCHLIKSLGRGGAETLLIETLRAGDRRRFDYEYAYFLPWKNALAGPLEAEGVAVRCLNATNNASILLAARRVARHLRDSRVDVLHCHLPIAGVVGRLAGRLAGVPVVYTEHNKMERYHTLTRRLNLATWGLQECAVAVSADVADSIRKHARGDVPLRVILNGVDVVRFDHDQAEAASVRRELRIPPEAKVIGTVAVFRQQKRLHDWLQAAALIREQDPDVHFLPVGDGPLATELKAQAEALGLGGAVHWVGLQSEVRRYLAAMDVYLMSSEVEGLPIALLEAMSMRRAVVATSVGGIPEVVKDGHNGVLVEPRRPDLLAAATKRLLESAPTRQVLGAAARRTVEDEFSIRRMAGELETTYREIVERRRAGR